MNVNQRNDLFLRGEIDREDLWQKRLEYESKAFQFPFWFGLDELPEKPGLIFIRGPRQYGKSTWLELSLENTLIKYGPGSALYLNGDEIATHDELARQLETVASMYPKKARIRRLFVDEVTAVPHWEKAFKIVLDRGLLKNVLVITTGSKAADIRRGTERLPGRKGRLDRTDYLFMPISFKHFIAGLGKNESSRFKMEDLLLVYLISGGSPLALNDLIQFESIPDYFITLVRDWILGEIASSGRQRKTLLALFSAFFKYGGTPVGYAKLARETGLANNTVVAGYVELLSDLMCVLPSWPWDPDKDAFLMRKPCKFNFINLAAAVAFHPCCLRNVHDFSKLEAETKAMFLEWLVASELFRRNTLRSMLNNEEVGFYQSRHHEIDFVDGERDLFEVKTGTAGPREFAWFPNVFPKKNLTVLSKNEFETDTVRSINMARWLYECPLDPWPYSGMTPWNPFEDHDKKMS
jgi:predicted AAA+ superfamily ATPase